jgi:GNAT superfamily N-acetyltransferase
VKIISAKPEHRKSLQGLFKSLSRIGGVYIEYATLKTLDEAIKKREIKIAVENDKVLGAIVLVSRKESVYIGGLIVRGKNRRSGIGAKLIKEAIKKGKRQKKRYISLGTAFGYNARGFYEKCGFYRTKTWPDAWSMSYKL